MNRQTLGTAVVGLVAGGLGALLATTVSTPAAAREGAFAGKPYILQLAVTGGVAALSSGQTDDPPIAGVLFRLWSDGSVDSLAFVALTPKKSPIEQWAVLCEDGVTSPSKLCLQSLGVVPEDPAKPSDVNGDGKVDGADLGILLGDWSGRPASE